MLVLHQARQRSLSAASSIVLRASATSLLRSSTAQLQARTFWGWRRPRDYDSRSDPAFYRFCRYRTLKTRAKLIDKLRRRGRWEWDLHQRPFFNSRHIRLASHIGRPRWRNEEEGEQGKKERDAEEDEGLELSRREKEWKDQMETMRKRIEQDPYEAVFGKRFEPFWSPLVPSWMREEMGLGRWPKYARDATIPGKVDASTARQTSPNPQNPSEQPVSPFGPVMKDQPKRDSQSDPESPNGQLTNYSYSSKKALTDAEPDCPNGQLTNYSYSSSTSWDSFSNQTRREEWDSISGQTRRYEYDPISNRMVQIEASEPIRDSQDKKRLDAELVPKASPALKETNGLEAVEIPVKPSGTVRTAIPVPTQTTLPANAYRNTSVYFPSLLNTSVVRKTAESAALAKRPERDLDMLTAERVRASVGKPKQELSITDANQAKSYQARAYRNGKPDPSMSEWDQAETQDMLDRELNILMRKKQKLLDRENGLFHIERQKHELQKLDERIGKVSKRLQDAKPESEMQGSARHPLDSFAEMRKQLMAKYTNTSKLEPALNRIQKSSTKQEEPENSPSTMLQASLDRMATKELPEAIEPDDSAAHESTGDALDYKSNVPREWTRQADLLQADRVRRTRGAAASDSTTTSVYSPEQSAADKPQRELHSSGAESADVSGRLLNGGLLAMKQRWIDVMNSRKAAYEAQRARDKAADEARNAEKSARLEKTNAMLEAEVKEQKFLMQSHENRYAHKIQSLRRELDTAYKQSSTHSEMHVDRIKTLEQELDKAQKAAGGATSVTRFESERERFQKKISDLRVELDTAYKQSSANAEMHVERIQNLEKELEEARGTDSATTKREKERYLKRIKVLREELDTAFKQSAVQGEKHVERIRTLEKELRSLQGQRTEAKAGAETMRAEGDISADAAKYAKDNRRWYKQPLQRPEEIGKPTAEEIEQAAQKLRDQALVKEVREIYEGHYGTIDVNHRQELPQSDLNQGHGPQVVEVETNVDLGKALADYEKANLENEIAAQEKEAHEAQHEARTVNRSTPEHISTKSTSHELGTAQADVTATTRSSVEWEEPPLYRVLAYDSGNDLFSVATTSSNFTGKETPISIPEALSQLYQPARFVPHFAELQTQGYQVIYGTKDLLVFKKVKASLGENTRKENTPALEDHGLVGANPIDGTIHLSELNTGRFASPTGFVGENWDTLEEQPQTSNTASAGPTARSSTSGKVLQSPHENYSQPADEAVETTSDISRAAASPRVTREERVFSGRRLKQSREKRRHHHEPTSAQVHQYKRKWRTYRSRMRWALGVGLGASVVAYGVGAAAERKEVKEKERWQQILEGRGKWE